MAKEQCTFYHSSKFRNSIVRCILRVIYQFDIAIRYAFAIQLHALVAIIIVKCLDQKRERIRRWVGIDRSPQRDTTRYSWTATVVAISRATRTQTSSWMKFKSAASSTYSLLYFCSSFQFDASMETRVTKLPPPTTFFYPTLKIPSLQASKQNEHFSTSIEIEAKRYHRECCHPRNTNISIFRNFYFPSLLIRYCESMIKFNTI